MAKRILIVEDDRDIAQSLADVLEAGGFQPEIALNGLEALQRLENRHGPDLILLDMMMPVMDGWEFRRRQLEMGEVAAIPVVVLTADGNAQGKAASIEAQGHISKPVSIDGLLGEVERICGPPDG